MSVDVGLLGPVTVRRAGVAVALPRPKERALLARLALAVPHPVSVSRLVTDLWPDEAPARPADTLRVHVANLRRALGTGAKPGRDLLETVEAGYRLILPAEAVDVLRFDRAVTAALRLTGAGERAPALRAALAIWPDQADALADVELPFAEVERVRLGETRTGAVQQRIDAELALGHAGLLVGELEALCRRYPGREVFWAQLMRAHHDGGRQADALAAYRQARDHLVDVGLEPGEHLRRLHAAVLSGTLPPARPAPTEPGRPVIRYAHVDGDRVAFQVTGAGSTDVLLLHGGFIPCDTMWDAVPLASFLRRLGQRFRVLLCDRRGTGMSDPPPEPLTYQHWVADCLAVLDAAASTRAVVFAHEHAGPAAVRLAIHAPERVAGLVLHTVLAGPDHDPGALAAIDRIIDAGPAPSADLLAVTAPSAGPDPVLRSWLERAGQLGAGPARARQLHRLYRTEDVRALLPHLDLPTLVLHAARNRIYPAEAARALARQLPRVELVILDSADHLFWVADGDAVLTAVSRLADRAAASVGGHTVLAAVAVVIAEDPHQVSDGLREAGAWAVSFPAPDAVAAAFSSVRTATAAVDPHCRAGRARAALAVTEITGRPTDPALVRCLAAARAAPAGTAVPVTDLPALL